MPGLNDLLNHPSQPWHGPPPAVAVFGRRPLSTTGNAIIRTLL
jgi:hypothetical protein